MDSSRRTGRCPQRVGAVGEPELYVELRLGWARRCEEHSVPEARQKARGPQVEGIDGPCPRAGAVGAPEILADERAEEELPVHSREVEGIAPLAPAHHVAEQPNPSRSEPLRRTARKRSCRHPRGPRCDPYGRDQRHEVNSDGIPRFPEPEHDACSFHPVNLPPTIRRGRGDRIRTYPPFSAELRNSPGHPTLGLASGPCHP